MASRRLALNLAQGLRSRAAFGAAPLKRGFATPVTNSNGVKTESTTLSNGLTVGSLAVLINSIG
jgi:processing peptidase subunit beta